MPLTYLGREAYMKHKGVPQREGIMNLHRPREIGDSLERQCLI